MTTLLRLDASARTTRSLSRRLADAFVDTWRARWPQSEVLARDIGINPPLFVTEDWIAAAFAAPEQRTDAQRALLAPSDAMIDEVRWADIVVMATPMYNYGMPASLKAWFDQVIRIGETFTFDLARGDRPLAPIFSGKQLVILTSSGEFGFEPGGFNAAAGHLVPHIRTASHYLGVEAVHHIGIEYQEFRDHRHAASVDAAHAAIPGLIDAMSGGRPQ